MSKENPLHGQSTRSSIRVVPHILHVPEIEELAQTVKRIQSTSQPLCRFPCLQSRMYACTDTGTDTRIAVSNFDSLLLKTVLLSCAAKTLLTLHISAPIVFMLSTILTPLGI
jgi:hypothetical protein